MVLWQIAKKVNSLCFEVHRKRLSFVLPLSETPIPMHTHPRGKVSCLIDIIGPIYRCHYYFFFSLRHFRLVFKNLSQHKAKMKCKLSFAYHLDTVNSHASNESIERWRSKVSHAILSLMCLLTMQQWSTGNWIKIYIESMIVLLPVYLSHNSWKTLLRYMWLEVVLAKQAKWICRKVRRYLFWITIGSHPSLTA